MGTIAASSAGDSAVQPKSSNIFDLPAELRACTLLEALELHPRPTFIVDIDAVPGAETVYCNPALRARKALYHAVENSGPLPAMRLETRSSEELEFPPVLFDRPWEYYTIGHWRVFSTTSRSDRRNSEQLSDGQPDGHSGSITMSGLSSALSTEYNRNMFQHDWANTPLGPMEFWSRELLSAFKFLLTDPRPAGLYWGHDAIVFYNEALAPTLAHKHPGSIGKTLAEAFPFVWEELDKPLFERVRKSGKPETQTGVEVAYFRPDGFFEEVYLDTTTLPIFNDDRVVCGFYKAMVDVTQNHLTQRRNRLLTAMNSIPAQARQLSNVWLEVVSKLQSGKKDIPQAMLYSLEATHDGTSRTYCTLEGSIACIESNLVRRFELEDTSNPFSSLIQIAMNDSSAPLYLSRQTNTNRPGMPDPDKLLQHLSSVFQHMPSGDAAESVAVVPLRKVDSQQIIGILIAGLNPHLPYDTTYQNFIVSLQHSISTSISSSLLWLDDIRRSKQAAAQAETIRADLVVQLEHQTREAHANELRFAQFARHAPVGICIYHSDGSMAFANEKWFRLTDFPDDADSKSPGWWSPIVHKDDLDIAFANFSQLQVDNLPVHFEIRLGVPSKQFPLDFTWVLVSAYPELEDGKLESIVACFTDISEQKWAATIERQRTEDAMEAKRQQESFVDITSHEIRNPLSAVLQCSEEISALSGEAVAAGDAFLDKVVMSRSSMQDIIQAAEIIEQCTLHQKRIVDDILTLSKMNGGMLPVNAAPAQPLLMVQNAIKFFSRELTQTKTKMSLNVEASYHDIAGGRDYLDLDAGRLNQMLVNLLTNAIKFTKAEPHRLIELKLAASTTAEPLSHWPMDYLPSLNHKIETVGADWSPNESVFLHFMVSDTGTGMTPEEQKMLFARFSQGSAKTYTQYGGSGLGLYICRALVEIHGGQIGFRSKAGVGSSFGFFIKTRAPPETASALRRSNSIKKAKTLLNGTSHPVGLQLSTESGRPLGIMIVEDNIINQKVLSKQLIRLGHGVTLANHGQEALDLLIESSFCKTEGTKLDVLLMDIEMPIVDGMECTKAIRKMQVDGMIAGHVPIIAITGNARSEKVDMIKAAGVDEVILKPFAAPALLEMCWGLLKRYESHGVPSG